MTILTRAKRTFAIFTLNGARISSILMALSVLFLATFSFAQIDPARSGAVPERDATAAPLPDAPMPQPHALEDNVKFRSNREVLRSKAFWSTFVGDFLISSFDAEMSHAGLAHHVCTEQHGLTSRGQLYLNNLPENAAVGIVSFLWVKFRAPNYVLPAFLAYPAKVHISAGLKWYQDCW